MLIQGGNCSCWSHPECRSLGSETALVAYPAFPMIFEQQMEKWLRKCRSLDSICLRAGVYRSQACWSPLELGAEVKLTCQALEHQRLMELLPSEDSEEMVTKPREGKFKLLEKILSHTARVSKMESVRWLSRGRTWSRDVCPPKAVRMMDSCSRTSSKVGLNHAQGKWGHMGEVL